MDPRIARAQADKKPIIILVLGVVISFSIFTYSFLNNDHRYDMSGIFTFILTLVLSAVLVFRPSNKRE